MQKIVIGDLELKLNDALALVENLQVCSIFFAAARYLNFLQEELKQERIKNESLKDRLESTHAQSVTSISGSECTPQAPPGSRLKEALSIISALRQSIRA
jgi:hypothetical protein